MGKRITTWHTIECKCIKLKLIILNFKVNCAYIPILIKPNFYICFAQNGMIFTSEYNKREVLIDKLSLDELWKILEVYIKRYVKGVKNNVEKL